MTTVAVFAHGTPRVIRHLDGGTLSVADGISSSLGISFEDAYNALHGTVASGLTNDAISGDWFPDGRALRWGSSDDPVLQFKFERGAHRRDRAHGRGVLRAEPSSGARKRFSPPRIAG